MSLKDKLRSLIDATFTSKKAFIGEQAMPGLDGISVPVGEAGSVNNQYIAPESGYIVFNGSANEGGKNQQMWNAGNFNPKSVVATATSFTNWMPVKKGDTVTFYYDTGISDVAIRFYRAVGGGYLSSLVKSLCGGGLCLLSHLSKRFSSSQVVKQCRQMPLLNRRLNSMNGQALLRHSTDILRFFPRGILANCLLSKFNVQARKFITKSPLILSIKDTEPVLFRVRKAIIFSTAFLLELQRQQFKPTLQKPSARLDFCKGGAL